MKNTSPKYPAWVFQLSRIEKMFDAGKPANEIYQQFIQEGVIVYSERKSALKVIQARYVVYLDSLCRPPTGRRGDVTPRNNNFPPDGWTVPRQHPGFNSTHIPWEPRKPSVPPAPQLPQAAPDVDFTCD